jgi:hypothetical protein
MQRLTGSTCATYRSPFVARLVANAMLDGLMQSMQSAGIVVSMDTLIALQALRGQIDGRVRDVAAAMSLALPATTDGRVAAAPAESVQSLLAELDVLILRLDRLQDAMLGVAGQPPADGPQASLPFGDPTP